MSGKPRSPELGPHLRLGVDGIRLPLLDRHVEPERAEIARVQNEIWRRLIELISKRRAVWIGDRMKDDVDPIEITFVLVFGGDTFGQPQYVAGARDLVRVLPGPR